MAESQRRGRAAAVRLPLRAQAKLARMMVDAGAAPRPRGVDPDLLEAFELFDLVPAVVREHLAARMELETFGTRDAIVHAGARGDAIYLILAGRAAPVSIACGSAEGEGEEAALLPGASLGEIAMLTGSPARATIIATQPTVCAVLRSKDLHELFGRYPSVALSLARVLALRLESAQE